MRPFANGNKVCERYYANGARPLLGAGRLQMLKFITMKKLKEQLDNAREEYYSDDLQNALRMEFRHGPRHEESEFKPESESEFYKMIVKDLIKMLDKNVLITKWGAFSEGQDFQIVNPDLSSGGEYFVNAKVIIKDDDWALSYGDSIYRLDEVKR